MKRYLLLFCTVVLIGALFAVPAFASELVIYEAEIGDGAGEFSSRFLPGTYEVFLFVDGMSLEIDGDNQLVVSGDTPSNAEFFYRVDNRRYSLRIQFYGDEAYCDFMDADEIQVQGSVGLCRVAPLSALDPEPDLGSGDPLSDVFGVFSPIGVWIGSSFGPLIGIFWNGSGLTFIGVLSVAALAIALIFLLFVIVVRFLKFSG